MVAQPGDFGSPEIRRAAGPCAGSGGDAAVGRDERKFAVERLLRDKKNAQWRAFPWCDRRGQYRNLAGLFAAARSRGGPCVDYGKTDNCACEQQRCGRSGKPA